MIVGSSELFEFSEFVIDDVSRTIRLTYTCGKHVFVEVITLPETADMASLHTQPGQHAVRLLHLIAGVSYYKAFVRNVKRFVVPYYLPDNVKEYVKTVYERGLGEFLYSHKLSPRLNIYIQSKLNHEPVEDTALMLQGYSVGLGGGKDSLVGVELLKRALGVTVSTFGVNAHEILSAQAQQLNTKHSSIRRQVDLNALKALRDDRGGIVLNGHIPISAILVHIGVVDAITRNIGVVVVAVERSANEPTVLNYLGVSVNHQWSKSSEFESACNDIFKSYIHIDAGFLSILRPLRELEIMKLYFAMGLAETFKNTSSSCNKSMAFTVGRQEGTALWCGECEKCAFIFLLMHGAGQHEFALNIMGGRDLFADEKHHMTYLALLGLSHTKPFDCVGEIDECRESMRESQKVSESAKMFNFDDPEAAVIWDEAYNLPVDINEKIKQLCLELLSRQP